MSPADLIQAAHAEEGKAEKLLRVSAAVKRLHGEWTAKTIRRWIQTGKIHATKAPNGYWLIAESEVVRCNEQE